MKRLCRLEAVLLLVIAAMSAPHSFRYQTAIHERSRTGLNATVVCSTNHQLIIWQVDSGDPFPASEYESTTGKRTSSLTLPLEGTTVIRCFGKTLSIGAQEANITLEPEATSEDTEMTSQYKTPEPTETGDTATTESTDATTHTDTPQPQDTGSTTPGGPSNPTGSIVAGCAGGVVLLVGSAVVCMCMWRSYRNKNCMERRAREASTTQKSIPVQHDPPSDPALASGSDHVVHPHINMDMKHYFIPDSAASQTREETDFQPTSEELVLRRKLLPRQSEPQSAFNRNHQFEAVLQLDEDRDTSIPPNNTAQFIEDSNVAPEVQDDDSTLASNARSSPIHTYGQLRFDVNPVQPQN